MRIPGVVRSEHLEVQSVLLKDRNGNGTEVTGSELAERGYPTLLKVQPDTVPPAVAAFSITPTTVAANGADSVSVSLAGTDAWSGVQSLEVLFKRTSDSSPRNFNPGSAGTWRLDVIRVWDHAGRLVTLNAAQAQAAGYPTEITVTP
jgi:hypothetical protein